MNRRQAKREACRRVAQIIRSYLACEPGGPDINADDEARLLAGLAELVDELERRGGLPPPPRADGVAHGQPDSPEDVWDGYDDEEGA